MSTEGSPLRIGYLAVGDELLDGRVVDTNVGQLSKFLATRDAEVGESITVRDNDQAISRAVRDLATRCAIVVVSGGLGPTTDDRTRAGVALAANVELELRDDVLARIVSRFAAMGRTFAKTNARQAMLPAGARVTPSEVGTADPFSLSVSGACVSCLPGVPREFGALLELVVGDALPASQAARARTLRVVGIGESTVGERLEPALEEAGHNEVSVSYLAAHPTVTVRISGPDHERAAMLAEDVLHPWLLPADACSPEAALIRRATDAGVILAAAESCTGGGVVERWTRVPGASAAVRGGVTTYATDAKVNVLGVARSLVDSHSVYSVEVAAAMAQGVRARFAADLGISTTGVAGPSGPTSGPDVGDVFVAVASERETVIAHAQFRGRSRAHVRASSVTLATMMALRVLDGDVERLTQHYGVSRLVLEPR